MPRFFYDGDLAAGTEIRLPPAIAKHIAVLRLESASELTLFNGKGGEYHAVLSARGKDSATVSIRSHDPVERELPYRITLAQGIPESGKMDLIVEKAVELGVAAVQPVSAERSVVRLKSDRAEKRVSRWRSIVHAACEQCGRNRLTDILSPVSLKEVIQVAGDSTLVLLSPQASLPLPAWAKSTEPGNLTLLIGPEGGFTPTEEALALAGGAVAVSMGDRILRTETAAMAAVAAINAIWGGM
ncbi:MAG: 16S rRNA (uracil(1498)-N(3))-methyltransferase [Oxalobacter sp.]|jgi:16S rRNA (uracil1498-N3)-methyltransferase|nr:16S rRNA (uracil(1498)-N(3))-methyltransferase [Oxalobacter sp.]